MEVKTSMVRLKEVQETLTSLRAEKAKIEEFLKKEEKKARAKLIPKYEFKLGILERGLRLNAVLTNRKEFEEHWETWGYISNKPETFSSPVMWYKNGLIISSSGGTVILKNPDCPHNNYFCDCHRVIEASKEEWTLLQKGIVPKRISLHPENYPST